MNLMHTYKAVASKSEGWIIDKSAEIIEIKWLEEHNNTMTSFSTFTRIGLGSNRYASVVRG